MKKHWYKVCYSGSATIKASDNDKDFIWNELYSNDLIPNDYDDFEITEIIDEGESEEDEDD